MSRPVLAEKPVENFAEESKRLARFLLANAPEGLSLSSRRYLERAAEKPQNYPFPSLDFERTTADGQERGCATIYVNAHDFGRMEMFDDAEGNLWYRTSVKVELNYSAHGSAGMEVSAMRVRLLSDLVAFGRLIDAEFTRPLLRLVSTAAELAERKAEQERKNAIAEVVSLVEKARATRKGMRLGEKRVLDSKPPYALPADFSHDVGVGAGKSKLFYRVRLESVVEGEGLVLTIERLAPPAAVEASS